MGLELLELARHPRLLVLHRPQHLRVGTPRRLERLLRRLARAVGLDGRGLRAVALLLSVTKYYTGTLV